MDSGSTLPAMWALASLVLAQYGTQATAHVSAMADQAKSHNDHAALDIWQGVMGCLNRGR